MKATIECANNKTKLQQIVCMNKIHRYTQPWKIGYFEWLKNRHKDSMYAEAMIVLMFRQKGT